MRIFTIIFLLVTGLITSVSAQSGVDIANARANPRTFIFDDGRHTVHGYIYKQLEQTSCCGNDAIYLEVKYDQSGSVTSAKTLTGKNDCYKKSVTDIVKNVKWDATGVSGSKTIYFEVKPIIPCSGSPGENVYQAIASTNTGGNSSTESSSSSSGSMDNTASNSGNTEIIPDIEEAVVESEPDEIIEEVEDEVEEAVETTIAVVEEEEPDEDDYVEEYTGDDDFLSDGGSDPVVEEESDVEEDYTPVVSQPINNNKPTKSERMTASNAGNGRIPPQADLEYNSKGERSPAEGHRETFYNGAPNSTITRPNYQQGESVIGKQIRVKLKESSYCGLAQSAYELTISPNGDVLETRILAVNNEQVRSIVPQVASSIKFKPTGFPSNIYAVFEFKTYIRCGEEAPKIKLEQVPNIIERVAEN